MDENLRDRTGSKSRATEAKLWLPPLSPKEQEELDRLRERRTKANNEKIGMLERKGVNSPAQFFKVWATPLSILIAAATLLWSVYQFNAQQQSDSQKAVQQMQSTREQEAANQQHILDQQRQTTLDTYLDRMSDLLLTSHLAASKPEDDVRALAEARTYAAVRNLDGARKGTLVRFLLEAKLINKQQPIISLPYADLSEAVFTNADLSGANLSGANLSRALFVNADLNGAVFTNADLSGANLSRADLLSIDLRRANLSGANLSGVYADPNPVSGCSCATTQDIPLPTTQDMPPFQGANLSYADLRGANLSGADLSEAVFKGAQVTTEQLAQAESLKGAIMPDGSTHP